jgi:hypothetical protein
MARGRRMMLAVLLLIVLAGALALLAVTRD